MTAEERVERLRQAWKRLEQRREAQTGCDHSANVALYAVINPNGSRFVFEGCSRCEARLKPGEWVDQNRVPGAKDAPVVEDRRTQHPPCQVCGAWGTELHHWAPREVFGPESEHWPTAWLCGVCHKRWHDAMRGHRQGTLDIVSA